MIEIPDNILPKNAQGEILCPKCQKTTVKCVCPTIKPKKEKQETIKPIIQLEKSGRKGKVVTLIKNLPAKESLLKNLAKYLKSKTGSGGTYYTEEGIGIIEIQGNHVLTITPEMITKSL